MSLQYEKFVRKPFVIEAVRVTRENIAELAPMVGLLQHKGDGTPYIQVNPSLVPGIPRLYIGFWVTKMGRNIRCYSKRAFANQFCETNEDIDKWIAYINGKPVKAQQPVEELPQPEPEVAVSG